MSGKKQATLDSFFSRPRNSNNNSNNSNNNNSNNQQQQQHPPLTPQHPPLTPQHPPLTPQEKAIIDRAHEEARVKRHARQARQAYIQQPSSRATTALTPALTRMQMASPAAATPPVVNSDPPSTNGNGRMRKRPRQAITNGHNTSTNTNCDDGGNDDDSVEQSSPIHPRKKHRTSRRSRSRIIDDDDEEEEDDAGDADYVPMRDGEEEEERKQGESDVSESEFPKSVSVSMSSKQKSRSRSTTGISDQSAISMKQEQEHEDEDEDVAMREDGEQKFGYEYDALTQDPRGEFTLERMAEFERLSNGDDHDDDGNGGDNHHNQKQRLMQRDPQFSAPNALQRLSKPMAKTTDKHKKKGSGGASHRSVASCEWYRNPTDLSGRPHGTDGAHLAEIKVPPLALKNMTPSQRQYWHIKKTHFDGILFFKVGKFYELYNCDAELAHKMCGLTYMGKGKDESPHVGFPEPSFNKYAEMFINYGLKVYRVEQTETTTQQKERKHKVVEREVCEVLSKGTLVLDEFLEDSANFILALVEADADEAKCNTSGHVQIGVCFMDFSTGQVFLGTFSDDRNRARLRTLIFQYHPTQCLYKRDAITRETLSLLKNECRSSVLTPLVDEQEFFSAGKTQSLIEENAAEYFPEHQAGQAQLPDVLQAAWDDPLSMHAFGAILYMLQHTMHDREILPSSRWFAYDPTSMTTQNDFLTLDGSTLANLEILFNADGTRRGTLYEFVEKCQTKFGKRMLEHWLRAPLRHADAINGRLDAIEYLMADADTWTHELQIEARLRELPDLERLLHTLNVLSTRKRMMDKAIMFDDCWQKSKVEKLLSVLDGFQSVAVLLAKISERFEQRISSSLVQEITTVGTVHARSIPPFAPVLDEFRASFDFEMAKESKIIEPTAGHNDEFDAVRESMIANCQQLDQILEALRRKLKSKQVKWFHKKGGKLRDTYQLEVPKNLKFIAPDDFHERGGTKAADRWQSDAILELLDAHQILKNKEELLRKDAARATFARFAKHEKIWRRIVENVAVLDCLLSLANVSASAPNLTMTRPQFVAAEDADPEQEPFLEIRDAQHPCIVSTQSVDSQQFIPNDTVLRCKENGAAFVILTGPNMGGKSTVLRQTCIAVILAHIGCFVPCTLMRLSAVDRIFTRVGANDRILAGQSTFMVELEETSNILAHATKHSLVILDELGRGTSTFDGTGIAYAVAKHLIEETQCRCLFSTHYHGLCDSFMDNASVSMYHMAYTKNAHSDDITFLYKLRQGICKQSHGINCAKMAGFPLEMLQNAKQRANELHQRMHGESNEDDAQLMQRFKAMLDELFG